MSDTSYQKGQKIGDLAENSIRWALKKLKLKTGKRYRVITDKEEQHDGDFQLETGTYIEAKMDQAPDKYNIVFIEIAEVYPKSYQWSRQRGSKAGNCELVGILKQASGDSKRTVFAHKIGMDPADGWLLYEPEKLLKWLTGDGYTSAVKIDCYTYRDYKENKVKVGIRLHNPSWIKHLLTNGAVKQDQHVLSLKNTFKWAANSEQAVKLIADMEATPKVKIAADPKRLFRVLDSNYYVDQSIQSTMKRQYKEEWSYDSDRALVRGAH